MGQITVEKNAGGIEGLAVIEPKVFGDKRGYFVETYNEKDTCTWRNRSNGRLPC